MRSVAIGAIGIIIIIVVGISIFFATKSEPIDKTLLCSADSDCVPVSCCHSNSVVNKEFAPKCADIACTAECEPGTMDCGQARPKCVVGRCEVVKGETSSGR